MLVISSVIKASAVYYFIQLSDLSPHTRNFLMYVDLSAVAEDNSNYMKDNYDVKLLQWLNKIIKNSFTYLPPGKNNFFISY